MFPGCSPRRIIRCWVSTGSRTRSKGKEDARQMIVKLTRKGRDLQKKLADVPETMGNAVICNSVTPDTVPGLFGMLDDIIAQLKV